MKIIELSYKNRVTGWNVKNLTFNNLTLLVGASGVGKTQILRAITDVANIAKGRSSNSVEWKISFQQENVSYIWEGAFVSKKIEHSSFIDAPNESVPIEFERLIRINDKELLIDRNQDYLKLRGQPTVKLEPEKSAISLLREEIDIAPVNKAFRQIYRVNNLNQGIRISPFQVTKDTYIADIEMLKNMPNLSPIEQLFLLYNHKFEEYKMIKEHFISIFPFVEDLQFTIGKFFNQTTYPVLQLKERGVDELISQMYISSGMFSTLVHLIVFTLAKDGDVILIDEFENSLGVNCIDEVADLVIYPVSNLQFVITSHHPYIINNIDYHSWKVVTRRGEEVTIRTTSDLHIGNHSKHDAYLQLIQSNAFKTGTL